MDKIIEESIELLKKAVSIPSTSRNEKDKADYLESWFEEKNIKIQRVKNNFYTPYDNADKNKPTLLLNAHIDTVKPAADWATDPYTPLEKNGKIFGLGTNDDGASFVSLIAAYRFLSAKPQPYNLILGLSAEEEITGANGIDCLLNELPKLDLALIGEPTNMQPAIAEKGLVVIDVIVHGKAGHAARAEGINAIYKALPIINWFKDYQFEKVSKYLGPVKATVTKIDAGTQHNVVPDRCTLLIDCRINEHYSPEQAFNVISNELNKIESSNLELKAHSFRLSSSGIDTNHPIVKACVKQGGVPYGSPTLSDQSRMRFPTIKLGPGKSERSHTANEFICISEIEDGIKKYIKILDGLKF